MVRVRPELHRKLTMLAENEEKSLNALVEEFLADQSAQRLQKF
jgi:predicted HicB family RNase H-like nuclease